MSGRDFLEEALKLPAKERGRLVHELIRSLDAGEAEDPAQVEGAWANELEARAERALRGETAGRDADTVLNDLRAKLRGKK